MASGPVIRREAKAQRPRAVLYATEKWGKTSFAAFSHKPIFLMGSGEDGLLTLLQSKLLPPTDYFDPPASSVGQVFSLLRWLINEQHEYKTLVIDTANSIERLAMEAVCRDQFANNWLEYAKWGQGDKVLLPLVCELLDLLDELNQARGMGVILLAHAQVRSFKNPSGSDFDRYTPQLGKITWGELHKWADVIMFGTYEEKERKQDGRTKVLGEGERVLYTTRRAAWDAGNRYGLPETIRLGNNGPKRAWERFVAAYTAAVSRGVPTGEAPMESNDQDAAPPPPQTAKEPPPPAKQPPKKAPPPPEPEPEPQHEDEQVDVLAEEVEDACKLMELCVTEDSLTDTWAGFAELEKKLKAAKRPDLHKKLRATCTQQGKVLRGEGSLPF